MIKLDNVSKRYGALVALNGISFEIEAGECVALLGSNGAGKTTALEILLGLRHADSGSATIEGTIAATPQNTGFPDALHVRELVDFTRIHYPNPSDVDGILDAFELRGLARKRVGGLSGGQQRRVALALAFVAGSDVVVLDEPSTGLDVESRRRLWAQLRAGMKSRTTLFTTHHMEEAEALATRIILIDRGEIRFDGATAAFREQFGRRSVRYTDRAGASQVVVPANTDDFIRELVRSGEPFHNLVVAQSSFEDIFLELTGAALR
jgi:ABC-2 type transport system ATP-binding protein